MPALARAKTLWGTGHLCTGIKMDTKGLAQRLQAQPQDAFNLESSRTSVATYTISRWWAEIGRCRLCLLPPTWKAIRYPGAKKHQGLFKPWFHPQVSLGTLEDPSSPWHSAWISFQVIQLPLESHLCGSDVTNWKPVKQNWLNHRYIYCFPE